MTQQAQGNMEDPLRRESSGDCRVGEAASSLYVSAEIADVRPFWVRFVGDVENRRVEVERFTFESTRILAEGGEALLKFVLKGGDQASEVERKAIVGELHPIREDVPGRTLVEEPRAVDIDVKPHSPLQLFYGDSGPALGFILAHYVATD